MCGHTIVACRERVRQREALGRYAMAEKIREVLVQEQDHQIDLATALGEEVPNLTAGPRKPGSRKSVSLSPNRGSEPTVAPRVAT